MNTNTAETCIHISDNTQKQIDRFIKETDWNKFWDQVIENSTPEIEAYQRARERSLLHVRY